MLMPLLVEELERQELPLNEVRLGDKKPQTLMEALAYLEEMNPFTRKSVRRYKRKVLARENKGRCRWMLATPRWTPIIGLSSIGVAAATICLTIAAAIFSSVPGVWWHYAIAFAGSVIAFVYAMCSDHLGPSVWYRSKFEKFEKRHFMPESVLLKKKRLAEVLSGVRFYVDWLRVDPFLVAKYRGQIAYIDVWGEPYFES